MKDLTLILEQKRNDLENIKATLSETVDAYHEKRHALINENEIFQLDWNEANTISDMVVLIHSRYREIYQLEIELGLKKFDKTPMKKDW